MIIELYGAGFVNKGAQFMLHTAATRLREADRRVVCAMERRGTYEQRAAYELRTIVPGYAPPSAPLHRRLVNLTTDRLLTALPGSMLHEYGLVRQSDPDAFVDISGYAFGDKWGTKSFERFTRRASQYASRGKPVVMLPQMFGPFQKPGYADLCKRLLDQATIVFVRDRVSMEHLRAIAPDPDRLVMAPDITIFADPPIATMGDHSRPYICIVPNVRMTDQGKAAWGTQYLAVMVKAARIAIEHGIDVHVMPHEVSDGDMALSKEILGAIDSDQARLIELFDPMAIKSHIATSAFIVSSRFHSIVGALSSGVPAITLGWAHKYEALLDDFDSPELLCHASTAEREVPLLVDRFADAQQRHAVRERLVHAKAGMRPAHDEMWARTFQILGLR